MTSKEEELTEAKARIAQLTKELHDSRRVRVALTEAEKAIQVLQQEIYTTTNTLNSVRAIGKQAKKDLTAVTDERDDLLSIRREHERKISSLESMLIHLRSGRQVSLDSIGAEIEQLRQSHARCREIDEVLLRTMRGRIIPPMTPNMRPDHIEIAINFVLEDAYRLGGRDMRHKLAAEASSIPTTPASPTYRLQGPNLAQELAATDYNEMQTSPTREESAVPLPPPPEDDAMNSDDSDYIPPLSRSLSPPTETVMIQQVPQEQPTADETRPGLMLPAEQVVQNVPPSPAPQPPMVMNFGAATAKPPFSFDIPGLQLLPPAVQEPEKPATVNAGPSTPNVVSFGSSIQNSSFSFAAPEGSRNPFEPGLLFQSPSFGVGHTQYENLNSMPNPLAITAPDMGYSKKNDDEGDEDDDDDGPTDLELLDRQLEEGLENLDEDVIITEGGYTSPVQSPQSTMAGPNFVFRMPSPSVLSPIDTSGVNDSMDVDSDPMELDGDQPFNKDGDSSTLPTIRTGVDGLTLDSPRPSAPVFEPNETTDTVEEATSPYLGHTTVAGIESSTPIAASSHVTESADQQPEIDPSSTPSPEKSTLPDPGRPDWHVAADSHEGEVEHGFASSAPSSPVMQFNGSIESDSVGPTFEDKLPANNVLESPEVQKSPSPQNDRSSTPVSSLSAFDRGFDEIAEFAPNGETSVVDLSELLKDEDVNPDVKPEPTAQVPDEAASEAGLASALTQFLDSNEDSIPASKGASEPAGEPDTATNEITVLLPVAEPVQEEPGRPFVSETESAPDYEPVEPKEPGPFTTVSGSPTRARSIFNSFRSQRRKGLSESFLDRRARLYEENLRRVNEDEELLPKIQEVSEPSEAEAAGSSDSELSGSGLGDTIPQALDVVAEDLEKEIAESETGVAGIKVLDVATEGLEREGAKYGRKSPRKVHFVEAEESQSEEEYLKKQEVIEQKDAEPATMTLEDQADAGTESVQPGKDESKERHLVVTKIRTTHVQAPTEPSQDADVDAGPSPHRSRFGIWASMAASSFVVTLVASIDFEAAIFRLEQWAPVVRTMLG